jgi:hypothetical protein
LLPEQQLPHWASSQRLGAARAAIEATGICRDTVKRSSVGTAGYAEIGLRDAARLTMRRTGLPRSLALAAIVLLTLSVFGSALWVFGATVGVLLAAPLTLFVMASVERLYGIDPVWWTP